MAREIEPIIFFRLHFSLSAVSAQLTSILGRQRSPNYGVVWDASYLCVVFRAKQCFIHNLFRLVCIKITCNQLHEYLYNLMPEPCTDRDTVTGSLCPTQICVLRSISYSRTIGYQVLFIQMSQNAYMDHKIYLSYRFPLCRLDQRFFVVFLFLLFCVVINK